VVEAVTVSAIRRIAERPVWRTQKVRAEDLVAGDVTRDRYGKWDVVAAVTSTKGAYVTVAFDCNSKAEFRKVALVDVQAVKPS
jgi:hypothetical protein